jgi:alpha-tubulin suppressor-like RCC1 family protein
VRRLRSYLGLFLLFIGVAVSGSIFNSLVLHAAGTPTITGLSPATGSVVGGDSITITGTNFDSSATVHFGTNSAASSNWINATTIIAVSPAGYQGVSDVSVANQDGQVATSVNGFTYTEPAPTISGISPAAGPANGSQSVTINGSNFTNGLKSVTAVSTDSTATGGSTCGIYNANKVYCWGYNGFGQLGNSSTTASLSPVSITDTGVLAGKTVRNIASGSGHRCVIASDAKVYCWGRNSAFGQLGNGTTAQSTVPVAVDASGVLASKSITQIATGDQFTCALSSDGLVFCWGLGTSGQLGNAGTASSTVPVAVDTSGALAGKTVRQITAGTSHACALTSDNLAYCWGANSDGRIGNNVTSSSVSSPAAVTMTGILSGKTISSIAAGGIHTCAIASDNLAYCWGGNTNGQLGNTSTTGSKVPVAVTTSGVLSGKTITAISTGTDHTCVIASDSQAYCWGFNSTGQLGNNTLTQSTSAVAVDTSGVLAGKTLRSLNTAYQKSCVIASDSQIYCWGNNTSGPLGDSSNTNRRVPVAAAQIKSNNPTVSFGGASATGITLASSTQLQVTTPAHALGAVNVVVQNYDAQSATATNGYQFVNGPTASSITPTSGALAGGTSITIKGTNFYTGMTATIGGNAITNLTVVDSQTITGTTPSSTLPGAQNVVISDPYSQTATLTNGYTYKLPDQTITSITPNAGSYIGGYTVTIKGSNFVDKGAGQTWYRVLFANTLATQVTYVDSSTLTATVPSRGLGKVNVTISSDYSTDAVLANGFTYLADSYRFNNAPLNIAATQPGKLTIQSLNSSGSPMPSSVNTVIQLSSTSQTGSFATDLSEDESTRWNHTSVTLPAGSSSVDVWYKDDASGTPTISGAITGATTFQQQETITSKYRFLVSGVSDPISSGIPSSVTIRVVDYNGTAQNDYTGTFSFTSSDTTAQLPASYTMTLADHGIKTFTNGVTMKTPGEFCVSATDTNDASVTGSQCNISVRAPNSGSIDHLAIITQPQFIPVSTSSAPITVQAQDSSANPIPVSVDTPLYLYSTSNTASFSTNGTTWSSSKPFNLTLPAGSTSVNFYIKDTATATSTFSVRDLSTDTADNGASGDVGWKNTSQQLVTGVSKADHIALSGPDSLLVNAKGTYTLALKDTAGNTVTALQDSQITLASSTSTALFYIDDDTGGVAGPVTILLPRGSSSLIFQFSDSTTSIGATMTHVTASDTRPSNDADYLNGASSDIQILSAAAASVTLTPSQNNIEAGTVTPVTLQLLDTNNSPTYASATTSFGVSTTSGSGQFSLISSPFTPINSVNLLRGEGTKQLYYRDTLAGTSLIQATNAGLSSSAQPVTVTSSTTYRFGVSPGSTSAALNTASAAYAITTYDVYGNIVVQPSDLSTYLYSSDAAVAFATQSNGPWTATSVTIPAGQSSGQFYAKPASFLNQPATLTVSDATPLDTSDTGIVNATSQLSIVGQTVASMAFTSSQQTITAGQVSDVITVQLKQSDGSAAIQDGTTSVSISVSEGKLTLTADSSAPNVTTIPIGKGSSSVSFYYYGEKSGSYIMSAHSGSQTATQLITVQADQPSKLIFISSPQTVAALQVSSQIKVGLVDQFDNPASFTGGKAVSLSSSCGDGTFSETNSPWQPTSTINVSANSTDFNFYYKATVDGSCTLTASIPGITSDSQAITITPTGPTKLTIIGPSTLEKGQVGTFTIDATDSAGNVLPVNNSFNVSLSSNSSTGTFSAPTVHFTAGDTTKTFTYSDSIAQAVTLSASDTTHALSGDTASVTITDGVATQLSIAPITSTQRAGDRALFTVTLLNQYNQPVAASSSTQIALSSSETSGKFYANASGGSNITTATIPSGQTGSDVYYSQTKTGQSTLFASTAGISNTQANVTVLPTSVASIGFVNSAYTGPGALEIGQNGTYQVALLDQFGNQTTATGPVTLYATSTGSGAFSNNGTFTIAANTSTGSFTYSQPQPSAYTLSVSDSLPGNTPTLGPITQSGEVVDGTPDGLRFTQPNLTLERGTVSDKVSVQLINSSGSVVPAPVGGQIVTLSMAVGTGMFSDTPNGTFSGSLQVTIPEGETEVGVYYRNDDAQIEDRSCTVASNGARTCTTARTYQHIISAQTTLASSVKISSLSVTMQYGTPVRLAIISPQRQQQTDRPTALITVERQNQYGKAVPLYQDSLMNVATSSPTTGSIGASKTTWGVQQLTILDSNASTSFYYKDSQAGTPTLSVSSPSGNLIGDSQPVTITQGSGPPLPAVSLLVTNISDPQESGTPSSVIIIAVDSDGFVVDSYAGTVHFTSDDPTAVLPHDYTFDPNTDKGSKTFTNQVSFTSPGEKTVTASDGQGITGNQTDITVLGNTSVPPTDPTPPTTPVTPTTPVPPDNPGSEANPPDASAPETSLPSENNASAKPSPHPSSANQTASTPLSLLQDAVNSILKAFSEVPSYVLVGTITVWFMVIVLLIEALRHVIAVHRLRKRVEQYHLPITTIRSIHFLKKVTRSAFLSGFFWIPVLAAIGLIYGSMKLFSVAAHGGGPNLITVIIGAFIITGYVIGFVIIHSVYLADEDSDLRTFFKHTDTVL